MSLWQRAGKTPRRAVTFRDGVANDDGKTMAALAVTAVGSGVHEDTKREVKIEDRRQDGESEVHRGSARYSGPVLPRPDFMQLSYAMKKIPPSGVFDISGEKQGHGAQRDAQVSFLRKNGVALV